jgi:UDP-N-acetylglucosamine 2-epimerase (non-hydrolysing)
VTHVVGARPNFPKLAPVYHALAREGVTQRVVHTGQHYDHLLSDAFFALLDLPEPDVNLDVGSASQAIQTARVLERIEPVLTAEPPAWLVVYGDVNSTLAATLAAAKLGLRTAHVEAGLRSFDRTMPEEINRIVTDRLADLLLTPSRDAVEQLLGEGEEPAKIEFVGNVMIDTLMRVLPAVDASDAMSRLGLGPSPVVVTLHRPSNVDDPDRLRGIVEALRTVALNRPVLFAAHPRTRKALSDRRCDLGSVTLVDSLPYMDLLGIVMGAHAVVTDSGGLQEETTVLGVPCLTVRSNTERRITVEQGTNTLVPRPEELPERIDAARRPAAPPVIERWDGRAGGRVADAIIRRL